MFEIITIQLNWVKCLQWKYVKHIENIKYNKKIKKKINRYLLITIQKIFILGDIYM